MKRIAAFLLFTLAAPAVAREEVVEAGPNATWRSVASEEDRGRAADVARRLDRGARPGPRRRACKRDRARGRPARARRGARRSRAAAGRSIAAGRSSSARRKRDLLDYVAYPAFRCRIARAGGRLRFTKLTGSQRPVGQIFPDNGRRMIFLGTLMLGDETRALRYGRDRERNLIGDGRADRPRALADRLSLSPFRIPARRDRARAQPLRCPCDCNSSPPCCWPRPC